MHHVIMGMIVIESCQIVPNRAESCWICLVNREINILKVISRQHNEEKSESPLNVIVRLLIITSECHARQHLQCLLSENIGVASDNIDNLF